MRILFETRLFEDKLRGMTLQSLLGLIVSIQGLAVNDMTVCEHDVLSCIVKKTSWKNPKNPEIIFFFNSLRVWIKSVAYLKIF